MSTIFSKFGNWLYKGALSCSNTITGADVVATSTVSGADVVATNTITVTSNSGSVGTEANPIPYLYADQISCNLVQPVQPVQPIQFQVRYVVSSGTYGYLMTVGSYQEIPLNMVMYNNLTGASLSSNRITLPVGTYSISAKIPMANSIGGGWTEVNLRSLLYNVTDSAALIYGLNTKTGGNESEGYGALLVMDGVFVVTGSSKTFSIQVRSNYAVYLGMPCSFGDYEQYSDILITKIA